MICPVMFITGLSVYRYRSVGGVGIGMRGKKIKKDGGKRRIWRRRSGEQEVIKKKTEGGEDEEWRGKIEEGRNRGEGGRFGIGL